MKASTIAALALAMLAILNLGSCLFVYREAFAYALVGLPS